MTLNRLIINRQLKLHRISQKADNLSIRYGLDNVINNSEKRLGAEQQYVSLWIFLKGVENIG